MQQCAARGLPVLILDRINPIGGSLTEGGPRLDETRFSSSIGRYNMPTRYGLTVGEFARWVNVAKGIGADLHILEVQGWTRQLWADETDLLWVNPSPNIPSVNSAINYIGTCLFEATNLSEGRGTTRPFDLIGAPFIDSKALCDELRVRRLPGVVVRRAAFTPQFNQYAGRVCEGVDCISPTVTLTVRFIPRYVSLRTLAAIPNSSSATLGFASAMGLMLSAASLIQTSLTNKMRLLVPILPVKSSCIGCMYNSC